MKNQNDITWKSCVYALLSKTNPDILEEIKLEAKKEILVAANLIATNNSVTPEIELNNIEGQAHRFCLNLDSRTYQSKGNWMWVNQLKVYFPSDLLLNIQLKPRVIDIPYTNNFVCAHWLFKHLHTDIYHHFQLIYNPS